MTAEQLLTLARREIGTTEQPPGSNRVKYNTAYYGWEVSGGGFPWCAVFIWWLFRQGGASELYFGGEKTAYCPALLVHHRKQMVKDYRPGDIIFFNFEGKKTAAHVGVCESFDGTYITTIDGNTGVGSAADGGAVMRRRRHKCYIMGAYRPDYEKEVSMTDQEFDQLMERWLQRQNVRGPEQPWQQAAVQAARAAGISDGTRPMGLCTRIEAMQMALHAKTE